MLKTTLYFAECALPAFDSNCFDSWWSRRLFCVSSSQVAATDLRRENSNPLLHHSYGRFLESFTSNPQFCLRLRELRSANSLQHSGTHSPVVNTIQERRTATLKVETQARTATVLPQTITYLTMSFKGGKAELWKPGRKVKYILLKATEKEFRELLMCFPAEATMVFTPEVLSSEDHYWDPVSSAVTFPLASLPSLPFPSLQSRQSLCEQAQGRYARV